MSPNSPQSNYSKRPVRRLKLPKIGLTKTKGLFEEYPHAFVVIIFSVAAILGKAGGLSAQDALVTGLWVGGLTWFAWQLKGYLTQRSNARAEEKPGEPVKPATEVPKGPLPAGMKPMIGPQWPVKSAPPRKPVPWPEPAQATPNEQNKAVFVYQRPKLPDRRPKLPANWPGQQDKKSKPPANWPGQANKKPKR